MEGKRRRLQSDSQAQSAILLMKIKGNETVEIQFPKAEQIVIEIELESWFKNCSLCIGRIHSSFAHRPHQRTLATDSH